MARKTKRRRQVATCGPYACFHGAFTDESKAKSKARRVGGFYRKRFIVGQAKARYVVMTKTSEAPF
jgi:hypothetical protein